MSEPAKNEFDWTCGHRAGAMCAECYRALAWTAHQDRERLMDLQGRVDGGELLDRDLVGEKLDDIRATYMKHTLEAIGTLRHLQRARVVLYATIIGQGAIIMVLVVNLLRGFLK